MITNMRSVACRVGCTRIEREFILVRPLWGFDTIVLGVGLLYLSLLFLNISARLNLPNGCVSLPYYQRRLLRIERAVKLEYDTVYNTSLATDARQLLCWHRIQMHTSTCTSSTCEALHRRDAAVRGRDEVAFCGPVPSIFPAPLSHLGHFNTRESSHPLPSPNSRQVYKTHSTYPTA